MSRRVVGPRLLFCQIGHPAPVPEALSFGVTLALPVLLLASIAEVMKVVPPCYSRKHS